MIGDLSLWSILTLVPTALFVIGACALAVWAARQRDKRSDLIERLRGEPTKSVKEQTDQPYTVGNSGAERHGKP